MVAGKKNTDNFAFLNPNRKLFKKGLKMSKSSSSVPGGKPSSHPKITENRLVPNHQQSKISPQKQQ